MDLIKILFTAGIIGIPGLIYAYADSLEFHNLELILKIEEPDTTAPGSSAFGCGISPGDINGDGFSDIVVVGGTMYPESVYTEVICVYYGGTNPDAIPDVIIPQISIAAAIIYLEVGDVNNDGYDDIIAGTGDLCLYFGGNPMDSLPDMKFNTVECRVPNRCGDINGDGIDDIIIGEPNREGGRITVYFGGAGLDTIPDVILRASHLGDAISTGFDVNNDGYDDILAWAYPLTSSRCNYVYFGGNPMDTNPDLSIPAPPDGWAVGLLPDLNGDSCAEICIGDPFRCIDTVTYKARSEVNIYLGGTSIDTMVDFAIFGEDTSKGTYFGCSVNGVKKIHSGGAKALIVGDCAYAPINPPIMFPSKGKVYIYTGKNYFDTSADAWVAGGEDSLEIGWRVASAGDINGDGVDEIMFSNCSSPKRPRKVWVCKYTGPGVEETNSDCEIRNAELKILRNKIYLEIADARDVELKVYDLSGRLREVIYEGVANEGTYTFTPKIKTTGIYFAKLKSGNYQAVQKLILIH